MKKNKWVNIGFQVVAFVLVFLISTLLLVAAGVPPFKAYADILKAPSVPSKVWNTSFSHGCLCC